MSYSDYEMRVATQIAYLDINPAAIQAHPDWTIRDHLVNSPELARQVKDNQADLYESYMSGEYGNWKVVDVQNDNDGNGFCGCLIDTGDGSAIIGYRGSESTNWEIWKDDWVVADVGLLNSTETSQQQSAQDYMSYIEQNYADQYSKISVTGHSLGGNLASHAAITASDYMVSKFDRVVNLDGPGFGEEYIEAHADEISRNASVVEHYHYSLVGTIFKPLSGSEYTCIDAKNDPDIPVFGSIIGGFGRHGTWNIKYDEYGNFEPGTPNYLPLWSKAFTNAVDKNTVLPGVLAFPGLLLGFLDPYKTLNFTVDEIQSLFEFAADKIVDAIDATVKRYRTSQMTDFLVDTNVLESAGEIMQSCSSEMISESENVSSINSSVCLLLKAASLFTLSCKLKKSLSNLNKLSQKSHKMSSAAEEIVSALRNAESNIVSNGGV